MLDPALIRYVTDSHEAAQRAAQLTAEPVFWVDIETYPAAAYWDRPGAALDGRVALFDLRQVVKQTLLRFQLAYPQLEQWKRQQVAQAQQFRQVRTRLGLVRDFDVQGEGYLRGEAQNIPVQGSAAEVLMSALLRLPQALTGTGAALYHTVHDEITLQVSLDHAETAAEVPQDAIVQGFLDVFPESLTWWPCPR
jgi:hypothetical protein